MNDKIMTPEMVAKICIIGDEKVLDTLEHVQDRNFEVFERFINTLEEHTELIKTLTNKVVTLEEKIKELEGDNMDGTIQMCNDVVEAIENGNEDDFMDKYMKLTESLKQEVIEDMKNEEEMYETDTEMEDDFMEEYYRKEIRINPEIIKNDNEKDKICKVIVKEAQERDISIHDLLEELPATIRWNAESKIYETQYEMNKPKDIDQYANIEFIGIREAPWALCGSNVILRINGQKIEFDHILSSGDYVSWGEEDVIEQGPWTVQCLPEYLEKYKKEIAEVINNNISWGCCGGCI